MGLFSAIINIAKGTLPYVATFVKGGITSVLNMDGVDPRIHYQLEMGEGDGQTSIDIEGNTELTKEELVQMYINMEKGRGLYICPFMNGFQATNVELTTSITCVFANKDSTADTLYIKPGDHAFVHLIPNEFDNWETLKKFELFSINAIVVEGFHNSPEKNSGDIGFLPISINTRTLKNEQLRQSAIMRNNNGLANFRFMKSILTGNYYTFKLDENKRITDIYPVSPYVNPQPIMYTDYVLQHEKDQILSYGTVILMKDNYSTIPITFTLNVKMYAVGYSQFTQQNIFKPYESKDDGDDDGNGDGDGDDGNDGNGSGNAGSSYIRPKFSGKLKR